jgi:hypothetical protein
MVVDVSAHAEQTCFVTARGSASCFGKNDFGQVGDGTTVTPRPAPLEVVGLPEPVAQVAVGCNFTCARFASGALACWGNNTAGQLGNGTTDPSATPMSVVAISDATDLDSYGGHSCAVHDAGSVSCWGRNDEGQIGNGSTVNALRPVVVAGVGGASDVATGGRHSCAAIASGVSCWGWGEFGQLGSGTARSTTPSAVGGLPSARVAQISAGGAHTCALLADGAAYCWGLNDFGQLGDGTTMNREAPQRVRGLEGLSVSEIRCGDRYTCARTTSGAAYCWGFNGDGGLGTGTTMHSSSPVAVVDL